MSAHLHSVYVDGCFRCDLSRDEAYISPHACDNGLVDRVACPEPCGQMHTYCTVCDRCAEACALDRDDVA